MRWGGRGPRHARLILLALGLATSLAACSGDDDASRSPSSAVPPATFTTAGPNPFAGDPSWIAYAGATDDGDGTAVRLTTLDGRTDRQLARGTSPAWRPDGTSVVFRELGGGDSDPLLEARLDGGKPREVFDCDEPCLFDDEPAYSPDGSTVAFVRATGPERGGVPSDCGIWLGDPTSGKVQQLTANPECRREYRPRWSPDGQRLVYQRQDRADDGGSTSTLWTIPVNGSEAAELTDGTTPFGEPDWSPDGEWIVFCSHPSNVEDGASTSDLYRIRPDGSAIEQLTAMPEGTRATQPSYSPDGAWIVFVVATASGSMLAAMPSAGGDIVTVADSRNHYAYPAWQAIG